MLRNNGSRTDCSSLSNRGFNLADRGCEWRSKIDALEFWSDVPKKMANPRCRALAWNVPAMPLDLLPPAGMSQCSVEAVLQCRERKQQDEGDELAESDE